MAVILPNIELKAGTEYNSCKYDIVHQSLFQTPLFEIHIDDIDNRELEKNIYNLRDTTEGVCFSNRGGWHSLIQALHAQNNHKMDDTFKPFTDKLEDILYTLPFEPKVHRLNDMSIWANINPKGSYNTAHDHPGCDLSGVYYVKVPKGECGNIAFNDPRSALTYGNSFVVERYVGGDSIPRFPIEGNMYIFPSSLKHDVSTNQTNEDRISLSFNLILD